MVSLLRLDIWKFSLPCREKGWKCFFFTEKIGNCLPFWDGRRVVPKKQLMNWWLLRKAFPFKELYCLSPFLSSSFKTISEEFGSCILEDLFFIGQVLNWALSSFKTFFLLSFEIWEESFPRRVIVLESVDMALSCSNIPDCHASSSWTNGPIGSRTNVWTLARSCSKAFASSLRDKPAVLKTKSSLRHLVSSTIGTWNILLNLCLSMWGSVEVNDFFRRAEVLSDTSKGSWVSPPVWSSSSSSGHLGSGERSVSIWVRSAHKMLLEESSPSSVGASWTLQRVRPHEQRLCSGRMWNFVPSSGWQQGYYSGWCSVHQWHPRLLELRHSHKWN